mgnify:CR=1 FL=1
MKKYLVYGIAVFLTVLCLFFTTACEKDKDFQYDINHLIGTEWGIPHIQDTGPGYTGYNMSAPMVFHDDGRVTFGSTQTDFWEVRDSRSLLIQKRSQIWQVLDLSENKLHVEVLKHPTGEFLMNAIFYPM